MKDKTTLWTLVIKLLISGCSAGRICNSSYSCAYAPVLSDNSHDIECNGYKSCFQSPSIFKTTNASNYILCSGSYSCFNSNEIIHNGIVPDIYTKVGIQCNGLYSI